MFPPWSVIADFNLFFCLKGTFFSSSRTEQFSNTAMPARRGHRQDRHAVTVTISISIEHTAAVCTVTRPHTHTHRDRVDCWEANAEGISRRAKAEKRCTNRTDSARSSVSDYEL